MKIKIIIMMVGIFMLINFTIGCNNQTHHTTKSGIFLSTTLSGVTYNCSQDNSSNSIAITDGIFSYNNGDLCTFYADGIRLGKAEGGSYIAPMQFFQTSDIGNQNVTKTMQLLLSLDNDEDLDNGVQILNDTFLENKDIESLNDEELQTLVFQITGSSLYPASDAIEYLAQVIEDEESQEKQGVALHDTSLAGKSITFQTLEDEGITAIFQNDGVYNDDFTECNATWNIQNGIVEIDRSACGLDGTKIKMFFNAKPKKGVLVVRKDQNSSIPLIIESIIDTNNSLLLGGSSTVYDRDYKHITFVNQTDTNMCIKAFLSKKKDKKISLKEYEAKYINIGRDKLGSKDEVCINFSKGCTTFKSDFRNFFNTCYTKEKFDTKDVVYITGKKKLHINDVYVTKDKNGCDKNESKPAILFVHGYHDNQNAWDDYVREAKKLHWRVFRTSTSKNGSIKKRAHMLNNYIKKMAKECKVSDNALRVVAHSMGGLDMRYILSSSSSKFEKSQNAVERLYTIATPHKGNQFGGTVPTDDGAKNLGLKQMKKFNAIFPYSRMKKHMLALRFSCDKFGDEQVPNDIFFNATFSDGVVNVYNQVLSEAPYSAKLYHGKHAKSGACSFVDLELEQTKYIKMILEDYNENNIPYFTSSDGDTDASKW